MSDALGLYERFLRRPGRWLYVRRTDCPCCDVVTGRDELQAVIEALPTSARRELSRVVARLDAEFERRTLPDPHASERLCSGWFDPPRRSWWHLRLDKP
ncbi:hypothetical protein ACWGB8_08695 [Kitasatospora sp. NPDC054939]